MHTILIDGKAAQSAQDVANAVHYSPEKVSIESGPEIDPRCYDGSLLELKPYASILFSTEDGAIGELHVDDSSRTVEVLRRTNELTTTNQ